MKRNASLDIIRGFAVVLVACLHSIGNGSLTANHISGVSGYLLTGLWLLSASCVPLFLMLSGYLQNRKMPTVKYYVNYLHIYIPYLLLGVISLTVGALYTHQSLSARDFVSSLVNFYTCEYSWFVMMYTGLFLLIPFLNAMYNGLETKGQKKLLILVFFALSHLPSLLNSYIQIYSVWWMRLFPVTYYFIGAYCSEYKPSKSASWYFRWLLTLLAVFTVYDVFYIHGDGSRVPGYSNDNYQVLVIGFFVFRWLGSIDTAHLPRFLLGSAEYLSRIALYFYLAAGMVDNILYSYFRENVADYLSNNGYFIVTALISFTASFLVTALVYPIGEWLSKHCIALVNSLIDRLTKQKAAAN